MSSEIRLRTDEEAREAIRQYLTSMDVEIVNEMEEKGNWGFWIRFGEYPLLIDHRKGSHYCIVAFQITIPDEHAIGHLNEFYEKNDAKFIYELTRAFTSALTAYSRILDGNRVVGFTVTKYIYPYHPEFTMRVLDMALQAVVSTGAVGISFLRWMVKELQVEHEPPAGPGGGPGPMFE
ncbi:hypothetical protein J2741_000138 [Methanolinea mesophila]|uniref:hypothetical protein n=1 Tax=Methanolinea mesophila TaxID=547055 RepID=UPI001AE15404|nr:hypothetical protein [Methanolinea mesophila]MBP1927591.1 hypothetical protein [Methanolinea mesophila]